MPEVAFSSGKPVSNGEQLCTNCCKPDPNKYEWVVSVGYLRDLGGSTCQHSLSSSPAGTVLKSASDDPGDNGLKTELEKLKSKIVISVNCSDNYGPGLNDEAQACVSTQCSAMSDTDPPQPLFIERGYANEEECARALCDNSGTRCITTACCDGEYTFANSTASFSSNNRVVDQATGKIKTPAKLIMYVEAGDCDGRYDDNMAMGISLIATEVIA